MRYPMFAVLVAMVWPAGWALGQTTMPAWEFTPDGRWQQVNAPAVPAAGDETLDRIEQMIQSRQGAAAKRIAVAWLRANKQSPLRDRGLYLLGQANFAYGARVMAFYNFDELLDKYPESRYYYPALQRQYDIADQFLRGYKEKFLGFVILGREEEATEMLYRIQQRAPGSPLAEKALLRAADHFYAQAEYEIAADAYAAYIRGYPRSPLVPRVRLRQAFAALAQFRGVKFDATPIIDARQQLLDLAKAYPQIAEEENFPAILQRIDLALAKKLLVTAQFYRRTHKPTAAAYYYRILLGTYPDAPESNDAQRELLDLPAKALATAPRPPIMRPATLPASSSQTESR